MDVGRRPRRGKRKTGETRAGMGNRRELVVVIPASNDAREGNTRHRCERGNSVLLCQFEVRTLSGRVERESARERRRGKEKQRKKERVI